MIWFKYSNSVSKFFKFFFQSSIFILQIFIYYVPQIDDLIFQTTNAMNYGFFEFI